MPVNDERSFNEALARVLRTKNPRWRDTLTAEQHQTLQGGGRPDVVLRNPRGSVVVVETEYLPARTVEQDAIDRLGRHLSGSGVAIEQCVAVRVPDSLKTVPQHDLDAQTAEATYEFCLYTETAGEDDPSRWPAGGWITGTINDLALLIETASISERIVAQSLDILERGISETAVQLREATTNRPDINARIAETLCQEDGEQTSRMAMAIIANALTFQSMLAGSFDIRTIDELRRQGVIPKAAVLREWERILEINYWPIFHISSRALSPIPGDIAASILEKLSDVSSELEAHGVTQSHDIYGRMFQKMISDRKFLATFYTLPASATLLSELAVEMMDIEWSDIEEVTKLRAADFACGTGTLITALYQAMLGRHRRAGGDDEAIHRTMMENSIFAADIMPAATHLTTSMMSSTHPTTPFKQTRVHLLPYGQQEDEVGAVSFALGALDLIRAQHGTGLFENTGIMVHSGTDSTRDVRREAGTWTDTFLLEHHSMDIVIMNPPFTRPTNHEATDVPVPSFAGLGNNEEEQYAMARLLRDIRNEINDPAGHGNAGLASNFLDLADTKIRPGGVLALVMPLSLLQGSAWKASRDLLRMKYERAMVVSLTSIGQDSEVSFSADTGMGEVLLVASRRATPINPQQVQTEDTANPVTYVALRKSPASGTEASGIASAIRDAVRQGASRISIGDDHYGILTRGNWDEGHCASVVHAELVDTVRNLQDGNLKLPRVPETYSVPTTTLRELGSRGLYHLDINGGDVRRTGEESGYFRGPFDIVHTSDQPTFPALWRHSAERERQIVVQSDSAGLIREDCEDRAHSAWRTATRLHFSLDFRLNSQSLAACLTPAETLGGRAWPNFLMNNRRFETVTALWANSTLGLILFWWTGTVQQAGRANLTISRLPELLVLDARTLTDAQYEQADLIFEEFKGRPLLPANEAYRDETRQALDEAVLVGLLGLPESILDPLAVLRRQWCSEPTVHGGKSTRPD
ncbi:MAG: hypothetical protein OXG98_16705 [Gemmatimonadetes bacterium]|nr:hypothetical protein [Gemmatimonadota bacterium]